MQSIKYDYMNILTWPILKKIQILNGCETFAFKYMSFRIDSMTTVKTIAIVFSNSLDPDQIRQSAWPALGLNY